LARDAIAAVKTKLDRTRSGSLPAGVEVVTTY